jgi:hypothetical protein
MNYLKYIALFGGSFLFFSFKKKTATSNKLLQSPVKNFTVRTCDLAGCGHFGASRGNKTHKGLDIIAQPYSKIYAPISGTIRKLFVYSGSTEMKGLEITNGTIRVKLFYVDTNLFNGDFIASEEFVGLAQDVASYHNNKTMTPHVHLELFIDNVQVDPKLYL